MSIAAIKWDRVLAAPWPGHRRQLRYPQYRLMALSATSVVDPRYYGSLRYLRDMMLSARTMRGRVWIELNMEPATDPRRGRR